MAGSQGERAGSKKRWPGARDGGPGARGYGPGAGKRKMGWEQGSVPFCSDWTSWAGLICDIISLETLVFLHLFIFSRSAYV